MYNFKLETYLKIIFLISAFSLISAYFIEFILGHQPCNLCLIERIPYGLTITLIIYNYFLNNHSKFIILLLILVFAFSFIVSFYHFGIEQGFFEESYVCKVNNSNEIISKDELLRQLQEKVVSCRDVTFRILGLSLTSINIAISIMFIITLMKIYNNYEKNKQ